MYEIEKNIKIKVRPTVDDVVKSFCEFDQSQQAVFFNRLAEITGEWGHPFCTQLQSVTDCGVLTLAGRNIMRQIGEYSLATYNTKGNLPTERQQ